MIHATEMVPLGSRIASAVEAGPYAVIGEHLRIGKGTKSGHHTVIGGWTGFGEDITILHSASIDIARWPYW